MRIPAGMGEKLRMTPRLDDTSILDNVYSICLDHGMKAVRDHQRRAPFDELAHRILHETLRFRVECGGRFIEQNDRSIPDQCARDRDALALPTGELRALLADMGVVSGRKPGDELVGMGGLCRRDDFLFSGADTAERDVVADAAVEKKNVLADIGDLSPDRIRRKPNDSPAHRRERRPAAAYRVRARD